MLLNLENPVSRVSTNGFTRKSPCRYNILGTRSPHRRSFLAKENPRQNFREILLEEYVYIYQQLD